ncbi:MAG: hypothetical protein RIM72_00740 [Alphaproteobacteria bacterium]
MGSVRQIDQVNFGLVLVSFLVAHIAPIELLVIFYAFVGPAHYLTEMAWLHERQYYTKARWDFIFLAALALIVFVSFDLGLQYIVLIVAFFLAVSMALTDNWLWRIASTVSLSSLAILLVAFDTPVTWLFVFLPNMIHIVVFTSIFLLLGALRNNSGYGFATLGALALCSATFFMPIDFSTGVTAYGLENVRLLRGMYEGLFDLFQVNLDDGFSRNLIGFVAFVNTYHYLNWFSKTEVIKWHQVPKPVLAVVCTVYAASILVYVIDYQTGFKVLLLLSFMHVVLEFPLNTVSTIETGRLLRQRFRSA